MHTFSSLLKKGVSSHAIFTHCNKLFLNGVLLIQQDSEPLHCDTVFAHKRPDLKPVEVSESLSFWLQGALHQ